MLDLGLGVDEIVPPVMDPLDVVEAGAIAIRVPSRGAMRAVGVGEPRVPSR
jgi:hypothetical protein